MIYKIKGQEVEQERVVEWSLVLKDGDIALMANDYTVAYIRTNGITLLGGLHGSYLPNHNCRIKILGLET
jgi:hypothetical protein